MEFMICTESYGPSFFSNLWPKCKHCGPCVFASVTFIIFTFTVRSAIAEWDLNETKPGGPFKEILDYDILVNCILLMEVYSFG